MAGNATVTLTNGAQTTVYEIWLQSIQTATSNEFMTQQVRDGISWIPVRRAEMFVSFTAIWPLVGTGQRIIHDRGFEDKDPADGFGKMQKFQDAIRAHQLAIVNGATLKPMILNYYNNSDPKSGIYNTLISQQPLQPLQYNGWIQSAEKEYTRFKDMFVRNYTMNIITANNAQTPSTHMTQSFTYAPTAATQRNYGDDWINIYNAAAISNTIQNLPTS